MSARRPPPPFCQTPVLSGWRLAQTPYTIWCVFVQASRESSLMLMFLQMRYLVRARMKLGKDAALLRAIENGTLGKGSIAGDEYLYDMEQARVDDQGIATWVETCFCSPPLAEERPYWEEYFQLLSVRDAHSRRTCRNENGTESWACCDCDCTKKLEERLATQGNAFLQTLRVDKTRSGDL